MFIERVDDLLAEYRQRLEYPGANDPPPWHCEAAIAELAALAADRELAA